MRAAGRVAIGVCTARRPEMLRCCLAALAAQVIPEGVELTLIVADNEPAPNNRQAVEEFAASCPFPVVYVHEARRGISRARNAVLDACGDRFAWIAFTDDDCRAAPDWIAALVAATERHGAEVVYGRREWVPPEPAPFWYEPPERLRWEEGQVLRHAATHNVLMAGKLAGMRFDEQLFAAEDTDFFLRATLQDARIVYSAVPVVWETIPPHRATLRYQIKKAFSRGANRTSLHRKHKGLAGATVRVLGRLTGQAPIALFRLVTAPLVWPFSERRFKSHVVKALRRLAAAAGAVVGLAGWSGNPYGKGGPACARRLTRARV